MARRSGDDWYVAAVTEEERTIDLSMSFLGNRLYYAMMCQDGATDDDVAVEYTFITKNDAIFSLFQFVPVLSC